MFNINVHCVIFGVNELLNKRCILSTNNDEIIFPYFSLSKDNIKNINQSTIGFLKEYIFVNDLILMPQIINLNYNFPTDKDNDLFNTLNIVFGFIVDYNTSIDTDKVFWINFDPMTEHKLSPIIFETIQKLS